MKTRIILATAAVLASTAALANDINIPLAKDGVSLPGVSGNQLLARCQSDQDYCLAWMRLAAANVRSIKAIAPDLGPCLPEDVDSTQLRDVVVDYLRKHPNDRHMAATPLAAEAFGEAWPCGANK